MVTQRCVCVEVFKSYLPDVNFKNDLQKDLTYEPEDGTAVKNSVALNRATLYLSTFRATECIVNTDRARENNQLFNNQ